jgi:hypothetical protein
MRGDFSRIRFTPSKQYTAVLEQQGRVSLDADANEQCAIDAYLRDTEGIDVIGEYGGPIGDAGFGITVENNEILISAGRYYVEGLLCENREPLTYGSQPFLINPDPSDADLLSQLLAAGTNSAIQVWLEVWERLVTGLDDVCLLEPALGQADTTVRRQTVWRVVADPYTNPTTSVPAPPTNVTVTVDNAFATRKAAFKPSLNTNINFDEPISVIDHPIGIFLPPRPVKFPPTAPSAPVAPTPPVDCCDAMYQRVAPTSTAAMTATTGGSGGDCGCQPIPSAGYRGLENQLYRVEIHQAGDENTATLKWSRENGSLVVAVQNVSGSTVQVNSLGPDANLGFQAGQWVEIYDDTYLFGTTPNQPGILYQIKQVEQSSLTITLTTSVLPVDTTRNARLRRWDQNGSLATSSGVSLGGGGSITLENGIQVSFQAGQYSSGDAWTIVARTASGQIEWPPCGSDGNSFQPPYSTKVYRAPLACIHVGNAVFGVIGANTLFPVEDCRRLFSPLTALTPPVTPQAIHVTNYSWLNDDVVTLDQLAANGLTLTLDQAPTGPLTGANFSVALELAVPPNPDTQARFATFASTVGAGLPSTILREITILDSTITVNGSTVTWQLPYVGASYAQQATVAYLDLLLLYGAQVDWFARARIKLLGKGIFLSSGAGQVYLDGECFGLPATRADGKTPCIALQTPSGNGEKASDFEGWFYLAPTVNLASITLNATAYTVTVNFFGQMTGVQAGTPPQSITPQATITLTYAPLTATTVIILFTGPTGVGTIVNMPQSVTVLAGQNSANVPIDILKSPGVAVQETFTITASVNTAVGPEPLQPVSFTVVGGPQETFIGVLGGNETKVTAKKKTKAPAKAAQKPKEKE